MIFSALARSRGAMERVILRMAQDDNRTHKRTQTEIPGESGSTLPVGLQLPEHVVDEFVDLVLIERVAVHRLLSDRAIRQPPRGLLHKVKDDRAFAEANIFVADFRRPPAPRFPASIRAANEARVSATVDMFHGDIVPPHCNVIV